MQKDRERGLRNIPKVNNFIYYFFTLIQKAEKAVYSFPGLTFYQKAGGDTGQCIGLTVFSKAISFNNETFVIITIIKKKLNL